MPVRIGKRRAAAKAADRQLVESNDDPTENRAAENTVESAVDAALFEDPALEGEAEAEAKSAVDAALFEVPALEGEAEAGDEGEDENLSNDDGCVPTPANVGSTLVTYEYNLSVMPGANKLKAVALVDSHIPVRIAQELGIWCDEDAEGQEPMNRRALAEAEGADGIYKLTSGDPDVIRTDVQCDAKLYGYDCVPVKASLGVQFDADVTTADQASEHLRHYISNLMEHEIIRTKNSQASYVGFDRPFDERPTFGGAGGGGGIVSSTVDRSGEPGSDNSGGMTTVGKALLSVFSVLAVLLAFLALKKRRNNRQQAAEADRDDDAVLAPAPEKPLAISRSGSDGTLDSDMDFSQSFEATNDEAEAEAEAVNILEDIQRTRSVTPASSPGRTPLPVVHEDFDPSFESEV
eukprot:CAMPEP_0181068664 /NCGR_PEP_ID=MMETSP1070-20121207/26530_1 /TAXON_ID=265543 /ORGANISM="Minutocellus polymorphus, Strain NH13" /LENGTH=405 /DNA_ID=CAMNT_0023149411 /DNA_START=19 /DNA_END=1236 /DNA_ORIENTATION=+